MAKEMSEEQIYEEAKKRVEAKKGFYIHLAVYCCVNILFIILWAIESRSEFPWFIIPLLGWGIGIIAHFLNVIVFPGRTGKAAIEKEVEKIRREQG